MKNSRGVDTEIKCLCQSKRLQNQNKPGEAGVLPAPPQSAKTKTSHPELEVMEHKIQFRAGVLLAPPQLVNTKTSYSKLEDANHKI